MSRTWFVTGSNRGLGRAVVEEIIKNGDRVIAGARKIDEKDPFYQHENVLPVQLDVTRQDEIDAAVKAGLERFGRIDVLLNNAGFGMSGAFEETSDAELRNLFDTDFFGLANMTKAILPTMRKQKSGMILNVSSQGGLMGYTGSSAYGSAKFAVVGLTLVLQSELEPFGIQVSAICPGSFRTDFRDATSMKHPEKSMSEYDESLAHTAAAFLRENNHKQEGDPVKAAQFIYKMVNSGKLPRRILIGEKCCNAVKEDLQEQLLEIDAYIEESSQTDY